MNFREFREKLVASELEPTTLKACLVITDILSELKPSDGQHLGLPYFYSRIDDKALRSHILSALSILCSRDGAILEMHGYLADEEEGQLHLSNQEFRELIQTGYLVHPNSGELVPDPMKHVRLFYSLKDDLHNES